MDKRDIRKTSGCFIIFLGISFIFSSVGVILTLVFGGSLSEYFTNEDGDSEFWWYKAQFWIVIIAIVALLFAGGKLTNIRLFENFPYKEDEEDESDKK